MIKKVLVGLSLLGLGIVCIRVSLWFQEMKQLRAMPEVSRVFTLAEPLLKTSFYCIVRDRGVEYRMRQHECRESGLYQAGVGDRLEIAGSWQTIVIGASQIEKSFIQIENIEIQPIRTGSGDVWWQGLRWLFDFRDSLLLTYKHDLPEPEGSLVAGIVLGEQASLPESLTAALRKTGLMHVVAASGYNVTVIAGLLINFWSRWVSRKASAWLAMAGIGAYVVLAGASPPVIRAGIMGIMALIALIQGRWYWSLWALGLTSGLMLWWWPFMISSISFQLSIAATMGMAVLVEPMTETFRLWREKLRGQGLKTRKKIAIWILFGAVVAPVKEALITTMAATIATMPVQMVYFEEVSWLGLLANPLLLWLIPILMYLGLVYAFLGIVWQELAGLMTWLVYPPAHLFVLGLTWFNRLPFGNVSVNGNWWLAAGWWFIWWGLVYSRRGVGKGVGPGEMLPARPGT
jgi:ComEC/Rec2-related protein